MLDPGQATGPSMAARHAVHPRQRHHQPEDGRRDYDRLRGVTSADVVPREQYPTGRSSSASRRVQLAWKDDQFAEPFEAEELSDGTMSFLAALAALFQRGESLIALDEAERNLHPESLYRLMGAAKMLSDRRPILLATQSDRLLSYLDDVPEAIAIVRRSERGAEVIRPERKFLEKFANATNNSALLDQCEKFKPPTRQHTFCCGA
jgi:murein L,D-transpeptidase YcbB/YkuD